MWSQMRIRKAVCPAICLLLVLILGACRPKPSPTIVADPALMPLVPADTTILMGVRVTELKKTPLYQRLMEEGKLPQIGLFKQETGIDLQKDIWEVVVASNGEKAVTLVRGKFTEGGVTDSGMEPTLEKKGISRSHYRGYTFQGDDRVTVTFLNSSVAIAGSVDAVRSVIDARDGGKGGPPTALLDRVKKLSSENQVWVVSTADWKETIPEDVDGPLGALKQIPVKLPFIAAMLNLSDGAKFSSELTSENAAGAQKLSVALQGMIGIGRMMMSRGDGDTEKLYRSLQVTSENDVVRIEADIPVKLLEDFLQENRNLRIAPLNPR